MITQTKTKKWGNSLGVVIPSNAVESLGLKEGETITIEIIQKQNVLSELFGKGSLKINKSSREMIDEFRRDFPESKWL